MKMKTVILILTLALAAVLVLAGCTRTPAPAPTATPKPAPAPAPTAAPIVLKAVTVLPAHTATMLSADDFVDNVKKASNGQLVIDIVGGPEAIPRANQTEAVRSGTIDMLFSFTDEWEYVVPETLAISISSYKSWENRQAGGYAYIRDLFKERAKVYLLGMIATNTEAMFSIFLNPQVKTPKELAGLKMRTTPTYTPFLNALSVTPLNVGFGDIYTSLQTKLIDGYVMTYDLTVQNKWYEVVKYWIDYPFYYTNTSTYINMDRFNKLPKNLQDILVNEAAKLEADPSRPDNLAKAAKKTIVEKGMQPITFSPEDTKSYLNLAYESRWAVLKKNVNQQTYDKLRQLFVK
ncbi:MAG: TRAP transporter substrate-binding protein DctP [Chloroflexi bacterium]|nr:TRAP transporter substrate-binding protein DctP [Chloroflexota bacterium]